MVDQNALKSIEDLHRLKTEGVITEEDFEKAKERLLFGAKPAARAAGAAPFVQMAGPVTLPAADDHVGWITLPLKRYADFNGRSTRREFWMFQLLYLGLGLVGLIAVSQGGDIDASSGALAFGRLVFGLVCLALLALLVPLLAVEARRLHDTGKSAWFLLLNLVPYVGVVIIYALMLIEGTRGDNAYGADPLAG